MTGIRRLMVIAMLACGCGARTLAGDDDVTNLGDAGPSSDTLATPDGAAATPPPPVKRTLKEFTESVVGVWEGTVSTDVGGLVPPARRVRLEFVSDGTFIGKCLEATPGSPSCAPLPSIYEESREPRWRVRRLTAGYEGMGEVSERFSRETPTLLHRMRLSADGQSLDFEAIGFEADEFPFQYRLKRVAVR